MPDLAGQTTIEPCDICGEPSTTELEIVPEKTKSVGGVTVIEKAAIKRWVCEFHAERVRGGAGWQERTKDQSRRVTREAKRRLREDQLVLL